MQSACLGTHYNPLPASQPIAEWHETTVDRLYKEDKLCFGIGCMGEMASSRPLSGSPRARIRAIPKKPISSGRSNNNALESIRNTPLLLCASATGTTSGSSCRIDLKHGEGNGPRVIRNPQQAPKALLIPPLRWLRGYLRVHRISSRLSMSLTPCHKRRLLCLGIVRGMNASRLAVQRTTRSDTDRLQLLLSSCRGHSSLPTDGGCAISCGPLPSQASLSSSLPS